MIINGTKEFKVIDLLKMEEIIHVKEGKDYNNDVFFKGSNKIWQITNNKEIEELDLRANERKKSGII